MFLIFIGVAYLNKGMSKQKIKNVQINKDLLSYRTAVRGNWVFKASVYKEEQVLIVGFNRINDKFFTRMFDTYEEVVLFLEYLTHQDSGSRKLDFPEL